MDFDIGDDRLRCRDCKYLRPDGLCHVAASRAERERQGLPIRKTGNGELGSEFPSWKYRPHPEIMRRCIFAQKHAQT
jgi:hypothetical protein